MTSTAIVLPETDTIFHELMQHTRDSSKCAVCGEALGLRTFNICRFPGRLCQGTRSAQGTHGVLRVRVDPLKYGEARAAVRACPTSATAVPR